MRLEPRCLGHPFCDECVDVARAVFAALCVEADERLERVARGELLRREFQEFQETVVEGHRNHVCVDGAYSLGNVLERGLQ
jgi:hypothetical protein